MLIVNYRTDLWWLFFNVYETLTVIVSNMYLFYVLFASLGLLLLVLTTRWSATATAAVLPIVYTIN